MTERPQSDIDFDRQKAEAQTEIAQLYKKYSHEAVFAAMSELLHKKTLEHCQEEFNCSGEQDG